MRMKKLVSRTKKRDGQATHTKTRTRIAVAIIGGVVGVTGAVAASMFAAPAAPAPAPASPSTLSPQRAAENRKAQAELAASAADYAGASTGSGAGAATHPPVTLTGCLEQHGDAYRLKDASGTDVPKSRSWKSGFLKKSTPALDVVDASHRLKLQDHVGRRVSLTGVLNDREMEAKSLKNVAASCSN